MKPGIAFVAIATLFVAMMADARLYRWTDEHGNVHFSDKKPDANAKGVAELDQRGIVRKTPEKQMSTENAARQSAEQKETLEQRRRDKALLDSFSNVAEIDALRDRQVGAVEVRLQTAQLRRQEVQEKQGRLTAQIQSLTQRGRKVPESLGQELAATGKEMERLESEAQNIRNEISAIRMRAEADKKRYIELRGAH